MLKSHFPISFPKISYPISVASSKSIISTIDNFKSIFFGIKDYTYLKNKYTVTQIVWLNTLQSNPAYSRDLNEDLEIYEDKKKDIIEEVGGQIDALCDEIIDRTTASEISRKTQLFSFLTRLKLFIDLIKNKTILTNTNENIIFLKQLLYYDILYCNVLYCWLYR